jgi:hypothetical protein
VPARLLMGPGPGNAHPRVLAAQSLPLLGHMHPPLFKIMDDIQEGLRYLFQTDSKYTLLTTGSGHSGMEACVANLLEEGDKIVVGNNGIWGMRIADLAQRYGGEAPRSPRNGRAPSGLWPPRQRSAAAAPAPSLGCPLPGLRRALWFDALQLGGWLWIAPDRRPPAAAPPPPAQPT